MENKHLLEKPSSFWIAIVTIIISFAVALASVQVENRVNAADILEQKVEHESISSKLDKMNDKINQIQVGQSSMKTDISYIKKAVIIVQDK
jgi:hypothetical protein